MTQKTSLLPDSIARGLALFWGCFSLLNLVGELARPGFDATLWWIDVRWMPALIQPPFLWLASISLLMAALRQPIAGWLTWSCAALIAALCALSIENALSFYWALFHDQIAAEIPVPLSAMISLSLALIVWRLLQSTEKRAPWYLVAGVASLGVILAPLAQMLSFGLTDYQRPADAILVFGARAYADGTPSDALNDRILAACDLYQRGHAKKLILSGGPGDGALTEPDVMKKIAMRCGVKEDEIFLDPLGVNTQATVDNTLDLLEKIHVKRVIAVSHFYHLPRIKMAFQRRGVEIYTSPAPQRRPLLGLPIFMAREAIALWAYYFMIRG